MHSLTDVTVRFGDVVALDDLTLEIPDGRTTAVIGASGCGKSTALRLLAGLQWPTEGKVVVAGEEVTPESVMGIRRRMGYAIQEGGLFPHLTAADNVTLAARRFGWAQDRIQARLEALRVLTALPESSLARYPSELSGGQRQRVALMRALMLEPDILLLDEPFAALDPMIRYELQVEMKEICHTLGSTVLIVTHDLAEAAFLGDTIVLFGAGKVVQSGTIEDFRERPASDFVASFVRAQRSVGEAS